MWPSKNNIQGFLIDQCEKMHKAQNIHILKIRKGNLKISCYDNKGGYKNKSIRMSGQSSASEDIFELRLRQVIVS